MTGGTWREIAARIEMKIALARGTQRGYDKVVEVQERLRVEAALRDGFVWGAMAGIGGALLGVVLVTALGHWPGA